MANNFPMMLRPIGKSYLWGGSRINEFFNKRIDLNPLAETWECSAHKDGLSKVVSGEFKGETLDVVLSQHPEFLGNKYASANGELPILVKFIDAKDNLSVQVHPDDEYAYNYENGQKGKSEMWYVLQANKEARLVYGLNKDTDVEEFREAINEGRTAEFLREVPVKKGDVFFIEAGTIHAIGKGALIAEIQENSNLTYRLYDYNRKDKNGNTRELHVDKALTVANLKHTENVKRRERIFNYYPGCVSEYLFGSNFFGVTRLSINTSNRTEFSYKADENSFRVLLCIEGAGDITYEGRTMRFYRGDCIFVPSNSPELKIHGVANVLDIVG